MQEIKLLQARVTGGPHGYPVSQAVDAIVKVDDVECCAMLDAGTAVMWDSGKMQPATKKQVDEYRKSVKPAVDQALADRAARNQVAADRMSPDKLAKERRALQAENDSLRAEVEELKAQAPDPDAGDGGGGQAGKGKGPNRAKK